MWQPVVAFFVGVVAAPLVEPVLRRVTKGVVRGTIVAGTEVNRLISEVREDLEDITAEAMADVATKDVDNKGPDNEVVAKVETGKKAAPSRAKKTSAKSS